MGRISPRTTFLTRGRDTDMVVASEGKKRGGKEGDKTSPTLLYLGKSGTANYQNGRGIDIERV